MGARPTNIYCRALGAVLDNCKNRFRQFVPLFASGNDLGQTGPVVRDGVDSITEPRTQNLRGHCRDTVKLHTSRV